MELIIEEIEKDIIKEIINISLAKAADSFAIISKDKVLINIPHLKVLSKDEALYDITSQQQIDVIIHSEIKGDIFGNTLLLFSQQHIDKLIKICLSPEYFENANDKVKESMLLEISNIITGTLVTQLANILKLNIYGSVPKAPIYLHEFNSKGFEIDLTTTRSFLVTINTTFVNHNNEVGMPLMLIFDLGNLNKILNLIRKNNYQNFSLYKADNSAKIPANK